MLDYGKLLGKNIKNLRKMRNLTQLQLAEAIDIDFKYLSRIETGIASPSLKTLEKLSHVLNVDVTQLFDFSEYKTDDDLKKELIDKINSYKNNQLKLLLNAAKLIDLQ